MMDMALGLVDDAKKEASAAAAESRVIGCLLAGEWDETLSADLFTNALTRAVFLCAQALHDEGREITEETLLLASNGELPYLELAAMRDSVATGAHFHEHVTACKRALAARKRRTLALLVQDPTTDLAELRRQFADILTLETNGSDSLTRQRFDPSRTPPPIRPIYTLAKKPIATCGNLVVLASQAKTGKTAFLGGMLAAATGREGDTLGVSSLNPNSHAVVLFDTEQSEADFYRVLRIAFERVDMASPSWLYAYSVVPLSVRERVNALRAVLVKARRETGGIHSVFIDGVADFVMDPNDPLEAFALVGDLHRLAVQYDTAIVCVVHFNPNPKFQKTRGHLGSQLERKAEVNLSLDKDGTGRTYVTTANSRRSPIFKSDGCCFIWSDHCGRHVACEPEAKKPARPKEGWF